MFTWAGEQTLKAAVERKKHFLTAGTIFWNQEPFKKNVAGTRVSIQVKGSFTLSPAFILIRFGGYDFFCEGKDKMK